MTELGADYSWARPGGAALRAAGVAAVGRYLATDGRGITAAEYADLKAHGIGVWVVREGSASGMLGGAAQGVRDAQVAQSQLAAVGLPANSIVYAAADWDVVAFQFPACDDYMRGFASVLGVNQTGIYGGLHYLNHAHQAGLAVGFWQAGATSWDHGEAAQMPINYRQTTLTPPLPGTDHNYIYNHVTVAAGGPATPINLEAIMALKDTLTIFHSTLGYIVVGPGFTREIVGNERLDILSKVVGIAGQEVQPREWQVIAEFFRGDDEVSGIVSGVDADVKKILGK